MSIGAALSLSGCNLDVLNPKGSVGAAEKALIATSTWAMLIVVVPVILLTARAQDSDVERGFASGADDYLTKPFSPHELMARIRSVLSRTRALA